MSEKHVRKTQLPKKNSQKNKKKLQHTIYNLGNNKPEPLLKLLKLLEKFTGKKAKIKKTGMQTGDVKFTYADIKESKKDFNSGWFFYLTRDDLEMHGLKYGFDAIAVSRNLSDKDAIDYGKAGRELIETSFLKFYEKRSKQNTPTEEMHPKLLGEQ